MGGISNMMGGLMGGGGKGAQAPRTPDFEAAAARQGAEERLLNERQFAQNVGSVARQTKANRVNQMNPFGATSQWSQGPGGQWTQRSSLGGGLGAAVSRLGQEAAAGAGQSLSGEAARDQAIDAAYRQAASRLDPQWEQREEAMRTHLLNQGFDPGSEGYETAMENLGRERTDAYDTAMRSAIGQGTQAGQALFGQNLASQMLPYQQLGSIAGLTGQAGVPMAGAAQAGKAEATQYLPAAMAAYQGALQQYGIEQQGKNAGMGGLMGLAGEVAPFVL